MAILDTNADGEEVEVKGWYWHITSPTLTRPVSHLIGPMAPSQSIPRQQNSAGIGHLLFSQSHPQTTKQCWHWASPIFLVPSPDNKTVPALGISYFPSPIPRQQNSAGIGHLLFSQSHPQTTKQCRHWASPIFPVPSPDNKTVPALGISYFPSPIPRQQNSAGIGHLLFSQSHPQTTKQCRHWVSPISLAVTHLWCL